MADTPAEPNPDSDDDQTTDSVRTRWEWTGTILAMIVVISLPAMVALAGLGVIALGSITQGWWVVYSTVVLMAATWTFGKETLEAVQQARGK